MPAGGRPKPILTRATASVPRVRMIERMPLCPPLPPADRTRMRANAKSRSSCTTISSDALRAKRLQRGLYGRARFVHERLRFQQRDRQSVEVPLPDFGAKAGWTPAARALFGQSVAYQEPNVVARAGVGVSRVTETDDQASRCEGRPRLAVPAPHPALHAASPPSGVLRWSTDSAATTWSHSLSASVWGRRPGSTPAASRVAPTSDSRRTVPAARGVPQLFARLRESVPRHRDSRFRGSDVDRGAGDGINPHKGRNHFGPRPKCLGRYVEEASNPGVGLQDDAQQRHFARFGRQAARHFPLQKHRETARRLGGTDEVDDQARSHAVREIRDDMTRAAGHFPKVESARVAGHNLNAVPVAEAFAQPQDQGILDFDSDHAQPVRQQRFRQIAGSRANLDHGGGGRQGSCGCNAPLHGPIHKEVLAAPAGGAESRPRGGAHAPVSHRSALRGLVVRPARCASRRHDHHLRVFPNAAR